MELFYLSVETSKKFPARAERLANCIRQKD